MDEHPNVKKVREATEAFLKGDLGPWQGMLADDIVWHEIGGRTVHGKEALEEEMSGMYGVELEGEVHDVIGNDDHVVALMSVKVTAGDRDFSYRTAELYHVSEGKITERWAMAEDTGAINDFFGSLG